jgi:hypothetical protein
MLPTDCVCVCARLCVHVCECLSWMDTFAVLDHLVSFFAHGRGLGVIRTCWVAKPAPDES